LVGFNAPLQYGGTISGGTDVGVSLRFKLLFVKTNQPLLIYKQKYNGSILHYMRKARNSFKNRFKIIKKAVFFTNGIKKKYIFS